MGGWQWDPQTKPEPSVRDRGGCAAPDLPPEALAPGLHWDCWRGVRAEACWVPGQDHMPAQREEPMEGGTAEDSEATLPCPCEEKGAKSSSVAAAAGRWARPRMSQPGGGGLWWAWERVGKTGCVCAYVQLVCVYMYMCECMCAYVRVCVHPCVHVCECVYMCISV